jgi:putative ABC transport system permease protein
MANYLAAASRNLWRNRGHAAIEGDRYQKGPGRERVDVLRMLLWQFARPALWANAVAWLTAGYFMHRWLQGFVAHVDLNPLTFLGAGVAALAIAFATVVTHALLVARTKPAMALRYE